jgi:hypothetical protein
VAVPEGKMMKNIVVAIFILVMFATGALVCSVLYFGVVFGSFAWLADTSSARVGEAVGSIAGVMGPLVGVSLYFMIFWERLLRPDGSPDRVAQTVAVIVAIPLVLVPLYAIGIEALNAVLAFKVVGVFSVVGLFSFLGWIDKMIVRKS